MRVSEALKLRGEELRRPVNITGYLIISAHLVCIVESEEALRGDTVQGAILVNREALHPLEEQNFPGMAGSSVKMCGDISLKATIRHTGLPLMPLYLPYIYEFTYSHIEVSDFHYVHGIPYVDIYLLCPEKIAAAPLKILKALFGNAMTIMEFRSFLQPHKKILVRKHVRGNELDLIKEVITQTGCSWHTEESEIHDGNP